LKKGAEILRQLDELTSLAASTGSVQRPGGDPEEQGGTAEARIEKAVAARRADASVSAAALSDDDIESMIAARRREHRDKSAGFCPRCGKPVLVTDRFCPSCGKSLT
jgi:rubrerythrin